MTSVTPFLTAVGTTVIEMGRAAWDLYLLSAPFLLLGIVLAGVFQVFAPQEKIARWLGPPTLGSACRAAAMGLPLPLCSCGVLPVGIALRRKGASAPATASFLITTPETSVDAVVLTWGLLGPLMAVVRPVSALCTGLLAGALTMAARIPSPPASDETDTVVPNDPPSGASWRLRPAMRRIAHASFVVSLGDIAFWLVIGLALAGVLAVLAPTQFETSRLGSEVLAMLVMLIIAIPLYTCASASTPIAAALVAKGVGAGAALVLLLAGPAVSVASLVLIGRNFGRRFLTVYLISVIAGSLGFGIALEVLLRVTGWSLQPRISIPEGESELLHLLGAVALGVLLIWRLRAGAWKAGLRELRENGEAARALWSSLWFRT